MCHNRYVRSWTTQRTISREMSQNVTGRHKINAFCEVSPTDLAHHVTSAFLWISKQALLAPGQRYYNEGKCNKMQHHATFLMFSPTNVAHNVASDLLQISRRVPPALRRGKVHIGNSRRLMGNMTSNRRSPPNRLSLGLLSSSHQL